MHNFQAGIVALAAIIGVLHIGGSLRADLPKAPSGRNTTAAQRIRFQLAKTLGQLPPTVRIPKDAAGLTRQSGVFRESRCLHEIIVGQCVGNPVDRARTLIHGSELAAVFTDAFIDVLDARDRRVVMRGRGGVHGVVGDAGRRESEQYGQ